MSADASQILFGLVSKTKYAVLSTGRIEEKAFF
jgi:hypothetical protein